MPTEDDTPSGTFWREGLPAHLRDSPFYAKTPTRAEGEAFFEQIFAELYPSGRITPAKDRESREHASAEATAAALQDRARAFAQSLIDSVPAVERIKLAAAPAKVRKVGRPYSTDFDPRNPTWVESRHAEFRDCPDRQFTATAARMGKSVHWAATVRAELVLVALTLGQQPPYAVCGGRQKYPKADEGPIASAVFPILWEGHERALVESEQRQIVRDAEPSVLRSPKGRLLADLYQAMTTLKTQRGHHSTVRALFKVLATVIAACREEISP